MVVVVGLDMYEEWLAGCSCVELANFEAGGYSMAVPLQAS